jgi:hypothetical protein
VPRTPRIPKPRSKNKHFVNNEQLLEAIILWKAEFKQAEQDGTPKPEISEYIGQCILLIATNLQRKPNFYGYSYGEDLIGSAVLNVCKYLNSFDPARSSNPFAWMTQIAHNSFLRGIQIERGFTYSKLKLMDSMEIGLPKKKDNRASDRNDEFVQAFEATRDLKKAAGKEKAAGKDTKKKKAEVALVSDE